MQGLVNIRILGRLKCETVLELKNIIKNATIKVNYINRLESIFQFNQFFAWLVSNSGITCHEGQHILILCLNCKWTLIDEVFLLRLETALMHTKVDLGCHQKIHVNWSYIVSLQTVISSVSKSYPLGVAANYLIDERPVLVLNDYSHFSIITIMINDVLDPQIITQIDLIDYSEVLDSVFPRSFL